MAYFLNENVYTHTFTPREYQVELLESSKTRNTIEYAWLMRNGGKKALLILDTHNISIIQSQIEMLTDLNSVYLDDLHQWNTVMDSNEVVLITGCTLSLLTSNQMEHIILLITDDCLYDEPIIDNLIKHAPRILALTASLLGAELEPDRLEGELQRLEILLHSKVDTSSEIVTLIRLSSRPKEKIIECSKINPRCALYQEIKDKVLLAKEFLTEHRFDPSEIYEAELLDELKSVPDPCEEPLKLLDEFLRILEDLGVWAADYAAASILSKIEKLKVKVPYERHFLLLCMTSTVLVLIRAICDNAMQCLSEKEKVLKYSTSKIVRLLEVLKEFKPAPGEKPILPIADDLVSKMKSNNHQRLPARRIPYIQRTHTSEELLCALIFVNSRYTAKVLFGVLCVMSQHDEDFWWISASYSVEKTANPSNEPKEAEMEHKRQEEVLRKFRSHECNIMIATSVLEYGCDLPKCHLVIRFDLPCTFHSYIQSKARARAHGAHFISLPGEDTVDDFIQKLAQYNEVENTLLRRCSSLEPSRDQEIYADYFSSHCKPYKPLPEADAPSVTLSNAIALINRYCAKLPSDTFTKLTPIWSEECTPDDGYICSIRLPINSPVKTTVTSPRMESTLLARRAAAFMTCQLLHQHGELDDNLQPIGKENFIACEEDWNMEPPLEESEEIIDRPGTTKRRQYYYKKIADALLDCHPVLEKPSYFYKIVMTLTCPLPEEQNTRGRKIYPPENSPQGFGIITSKLIPKISAFPIFTRSGEVSVNLELCSSQIILNKRQMDKIREFVNYTFTSVLRLQKYLMLFDPDASCNSYLIVPTFQGADKQESIDWNFIDVIYEKLSVLPETIPVAQRMAYKFESGAYGDAVVMPWYRNQDQPQYFYVAEICSHLNPKSAFPGSEYATFEEYYMRKYNIQIQNLDQHLLDVDHTSARLNFLTPRYVNRKGVALPTSSEETKKAKRENLEQKQILVPELCAIHPFSASLWRKAVCLPCILYRINALLLADQIRRTVAQELGLGKHILPEDFKWPPLHFGWSLSDVLQKSKDEDISKQLHTTLDHPELLKETKQVDELDKIGTPKESWDIGMWSNDMIDTDNMRYVSPTSSMNDFDDDFSYSESFYSSSDESEDDIKGYRIEFTGNFIAEAVETDLPQEQEFNLIEQPNAWKTDNQFQIIDSLKEQFHEACALNKQNILSSGMVVRKEEKFVRNPEALNISKDISECNNTPSFDFSQLFVTAKKKVFSPPCAESVPKTNVNIDKFSFDMQPNLEEHFGPSPNVLLQGLTMSNANDGINLERLETIGDSFLKYAITNYLYSKYENIHEGKLSHLRSKQVSNLNLYRLGKRKGLGEFMIATKFDPHDNWLPPCFYVPKELEEALQDAQYPANCWTVAEMAATRDMTLKDICNMVREKKCNETLTLPTVIPYNLVTQHSIPDKSIADCVEALIGAYLIECGPRGALLFMAWLGIRVLPVLDNGSYGEIPLPSSPLLRSVPNPEQELDMLLDGYHKFETHIGYTFNDRAYLLQALTHASYSPNKLTDCYQRLEFLGDAVLDYLITRHLYEDARMHSPGALTDLRSALVNNTIFASLAVRNGFHRYFRHLSPGLNEVVEKFIRLQEESGHNIVEELYLVVETESEEVEDVEVPKALGDVFESVAGAIFLDSQMSLDAVWSVYHKMMQAEIEQFSNRVPKSPIRELLELEPETAKFGKPEKLADGRRVRVTVEVFGKGLFKGIGRNYRIAKCTAAKCALKHLKRRGLINKRTED